MAGAEFLGDMILAKAQSRRQFAADDAIGENPADAACDCVFRFLAQTHPLEGWNGLVEAGAKGNRSQIRQENDKAARKAQSSHAGLPVELSAPIV